MRENPTHLLTSPSNVFQKNFRLFQRKIHVGQVGISSICKQITSSTSTIVYKMESLSRRDSRASTKTTLHEISAENPLRKKAH